MTHSTLVPAALRPAAHLATLGVPKERSNFEKNDMLKYVR